MSNETPPAPASVLDTVAPGDWGTALAAPAPRAAAAAAQVAVEAAPAPVAAPEVLYLSNRARVQVVDLDEPFTFEGVTYTSVTCRRLTVAQLDAFYELPVEERNLLPTIDLPGRAFAVMDADDGEKVRRIGLGFLPQSLRMGSEPTPAPSDTSPGSSAEN